MSQAALEGALIVGGRYALSDRIAQGGMAVVWRGLDLRLHRDVAIKILTQRDDNDRDRVLREARLLAATPHPNVVQVLDVGVDAERPYIVMELLEGTGLDRVLARGTVPATDALEVVGAALDGLAVVHARGIVHRDLKPSNLFLARDPGSLEPSTDSLLSGRRLKILDFGVSRATDRTTPMKSALTTREGALVGTPEYMAPEQARGLPEIGPAADLYALGVILFECLTGKLPFESPNAGDLIIAIATQPPPRIEELRPDLPPSVAALVHRALAKRPEDRFESALAMRKVVEAVRAEIEGSGSARVSHEQIARADRSAAITLDAPLGRASVSRPALRDSQPTRLFAALAVVGVVVLLGLGYLVVQSDPSHEQSAGDAAPTAVGPTSLAPTAVAPTAVAPTAGALEPSHERSDVAAEPETTPDALPLPTSSDDTEVTRPASARSARTESGASQRTEAERRGARPRETEASENEASENEAAETEAGESEAREAEGTPSTPRFRQLDY